MPHCQKETHDHNAKSKQERKAKKALALSRKKAAKQKAAEDELELEKQKNLKNNLALADGFGEYEVGCKEEKEYVAKFNLNKRSKKHLRIDIRKAQEKKEREEEERRREEEQEKYRLRREKEQEQEQKQERLRLRLKLEQEDKEGRCYPAPENQPELEPQPIVEEYLVYVCQCCNKKFNTTNQFINHSRSKKHRDNARLYEEAGVIVTDVKLRSDFDDDDNDNYEDGGGDYEDGDGDSDYEDGVLVNGSNRGSDDDELDYDDNNDNEDDSEEEEYYEEPPKRGNTFSAFAGFGDSDSDSSSSDSDSSDGENSEDIDEDENDDQVKELPSDVTGNEEEKEDVEDEDDLDLLEEIIYQNRLQDRFYGDYCGDDNENNDVDDDKATDAVVPIPFDDDQYNPDYYTADENRLVSVQHRLQKRLAAKGIAPSNINPGSRTSDAVSMGKTLLQQVMAASIETLEAKLEAYKQHKAEYQLLGRDFRFAKGNSKALASQYTFRIDPSDNARRRENIHHTGSHYHMQAARSMQHGRQKGLMARHSSQGSRLQASRIAAKEMQRVHGKGMKVGKTSKKSNQKRRGEAGGSKKSGGTSSEK